MMQEWKLNAALAGGSCVAAGIVLTRLPTVDTLVGSFTVLLIAASFLYVGYNWYQKSVRRK